MGYGRAVLALLVLVTSGLAAAVPRLYNQVLDSELARRVDDASLIQRSITASLSQRYNNPNQEICARLSEMGDAYQQALPEPLRDAISEPQFTIEGPAFLVADDLNGNTPPFARMLQVRYQQDVESHVEFIDGRLPQVQDEVAPPTSATLPENRTERPLPLVEVALSERTAARLELAVGDRMLAVFDDAETVYEQGPGSWLMIEVAGIFIKAESEGTYWESDLEFDLVSERDTASIPFTTGRTDEGLALTGTALIAPEAYPEWARLTELADWTYSWRFPVDPDTIDATNYRDVDIQSGNLAVTKGPYEAPDWPPNRLRVSTPIPLLFRGFEEQTRFTLSVIALTALGVFGTAATAFGLLGTLISERRRAGVLLLRSRGATRAQLIGTRVVEGILVCVPAAVAGFLAANLLVDARESRWSIWCAAGVAIIMLAVLVLSAEPVRVADLGRLLRHSLDSVGNRSTRRLTLELTIVFIAVAGLAALRQRGLTADSNPDASLDPLLIAVPLLLALVAGMVGHRLYPHVVGLLAQVARRGRGLVWFIGLRRGSDPNSGGFLPFVVLLLAISISVFASVIAQSLSQAQQQTAWQMVGADYRIDAAPFDPDLALEHQPELADDTAGALSTDANLRIATSGGRFAGSSSTQVTAVALDVPAYQHLIGRRVAPFTLPGGQQNNAAEFGSAENPVPTIIATGWPGSDRPESGDLMLVELLIPSVGTLQVHAQADGYSAQYPGVESGRPFVLFSLAVLRAIAPEHTTRATTLFVRGSQQDAGAIAGAIEAQTSAPVEITSRSRVYDALRQEPLSNAVTTTFRSGAALAGLYAGLALLVALTLTARRRTYDLSVLRTLGLPLQRAGAVIAVEYVPLIAFAAVSGVALGIATTFAIAPGVDLSAFTGADTAIALSIDWLVVLLVVLGLTAVAAATIAAYVILNRGRRLGEILRVSD